jgi:predicted acyl esterase
MVETQTEVQDGMHIEWGVAIQIRDGLHVRADVFYPDKPGRFSVIMTYGLDGKGLAFQVVRTTCWEPMASDHPDAVKGTANKYQKVQQWSLKSTRWSCLYLEADAASLSTRPPLRSANIS